MHVGFWNLKKKPLIIRLIPIILFITVISLLSITLTIIIARSPIRLGVIVLFIALFTAFFLASYLSGWFGLITFIIYIGGILVIFAYFAALQPNQHITSPAIFILPVIVIIRYIIVTLITPIIYNSSIPTITILILSPYFLLFLGLALLLFLALIAVVKVSRSHEGPLRPFYV